MAMPLVYGCVVPHGSEIIPPLAGKSLKLFSATRKGVRALAEDIADAKPGTIVVATPHNLRLAKHIGVVVSEFSSGRLSEGKREVRLQSKGDVEFAKKLVEKGEARGLPIVAANYGTLEGPLSDLAMDWGTLVPLWFFLRKCPGARVVIVTPSRGIPLEQNFEFGKVVAEVAQGWKGRVAFVASADQAHAHKKDGPYGFSPEAREYDARVVKAIESGNLSSVMRLERGLVEAAKPDSLWQMTMLAGSLSVVPMEGRLVSYQVPTYYGMLCASYTPRRKPQF